MQLMLLLAMRPPDYLHASSTRHHTQRAERRRLLHNDLHFSPTTTTERSAHSTASTHTKQLSCI